MVNGCKYIYLHGITTTGKVEELKNKISTLKKQVYGFRDMFYFKLRLFHLHKQNYSLSG